MPLRLNVLTQPESIEAALTDPTQPNAFYRLPELIINDTLDLELFFMDGALGLEPWSGDLNYELRVGIGELGGVPAGGTFVLKDDLSETMELALSAPAQDVKDVLNGMNSGTGPFSGLLDASKVATGIYTLKRRDLGAFPVIEGDGTLLSPDSTVVIDEVQPGSPTQAQVLSIRLIRQPYAFNDVWEAIVDDSTGVTVGFSGSLSLNTLRMMQFLAGKASAKAWFEIEVTDPLGNVITHAQEKVTIRNEVIGNAVSDPANFPPEAAKYVQNKFAVSSLTGGGATALDGLATFNRGLGTLVGVEVTAGEVSLYRLESGTDAESLPDIVRPLDFDETDNPKVWKRKLSQAKVLRRTSASSLTINAAGTTTIDLAADEIVHVRRLNIAGSNYLHDVVLEETHAKPGDLVFLYLTGQCAGVQIRVRDNDPIIVDRASFNFKDNLYQQACVGLAFMGTGIGQSFGSWYVISCSTSNGNFSAFNPFNVLEPVQWRRSFSTQAYALTDAASITTDADLSNVFSVTLGGNRTLANPTNYKNGQTLVWVIKQDATGGRTLSFGSLFKFPGGTPPTLSTAADAVDVLTGVVSGSSILCTLQADFK